MLPSPLVIAHRGAPGYRPEHTLAGYELAARMGADALEPDLVLTADAVLVARHENELSVTTDVAHRPEFADRRTARTVGGRRLTGWFTEDFTLAELKTLRAVERMPDLRGASARHDGRYEVATFAEILDLRSRLAVELGRPVAVYPEVKHPAYFEGIGLPPYVPLLGALAAAGLDDAAAPVFVQCFDAGFLRRLRDAGTPARLVQLLPAAAPLPSVAEVAEYADGIGPEKSLVIPRDGRGRLGEPTPLVRQAHDAGLLVHVYTFRDEPRFLPATDPAEPTPVGGHAIAEQVAFLRAGIDGLFTDHPDTGALARRLRRAEVEAAAWSLPA